MTDIGAKILEGLDMTREEAKGFLQGLRNVANDSYLNLITGLGRTDRDHRRSDRTMPHIALTPEEIEDLYDGDYIAQNVCEIPAGDAVRRGASIVVIDESIKPPDDSSPDAGAAISDELDVMGADVALRECQRLDRKDGASAALIAADDGITNPAQLRLPLDPTKIKKLASILPLERGSIRPHGPTILDLTSRNFGIASTWMVRLQDTAVQGPTTATSQTLQEIEIHASRLLIWRGRPLSRMSRGRGGRRDAWGGDSVLEVLAEPLRRYRTFLGYLEATFKRFSVIVMRMAGLAQLVNESGQKEVMSRLRLVTMAMSTLNALPVDKDTEEVVELASTLAGVAEIMTEAKDDVAGAARMPLTKIFGHAPRGFAEDDKPGKDNHNNQIEDIQKIKLLPAYNELIRLLCLMPSGPTRGRLPKRWQVVFRPLTTPTETEREENFSKRANTLKVISDAQFISPIEGRNTLRADAMSPLVLEDGDGPAGLVLDEPELDPLPGDKPKPGEPGEGGPGAL